MGVRSILLAENGREIAPCNPKMNFFLHFTTIASILNNDERTPGTLKMILLNPWNAFDLIQIKFRTNLGFPTFRPENLPKHGPASVANDFRSPK